MCTRPTPVCSAPWCTYVCHAAVAEQRSEADMSSLYETRRTSAEAVGTQALGKQKTRNFGGYVRHPAAVRTNVCERALTGRTTKNFQAHTIRPCFRKAVAGDSHDRLYSVHGAYHSTSVCPPPSLPFANLHTQITPHGVKCPGPPFVQAFPCHEASSITAVQAQVWHSV